MVIYVQNCKVSISVKNNFIIIRNVIKVLDKKFLRGIRKDLNRCIRTTILVIALWAYTKCAL
jgi:hypothetical protein